MTISKNQFDNLYAPINLNANKQQFHALAQGKNVRLNHQQIKGGKIHVYLNKSQINHLKRALVNQRGASIKLCLNQLHHHALHGKGFFSYLVRHLKAGAKRVYHHVKPIVQPALHEVGRHLKNESESLLRQGVDKLRERAIQEITNQSHRASRRIAGGKIKPKPKAPIRRKRTKVKDSSAVRAGSTGRVKQGLKVRKPAVRKRTKVKVSITESIPKSKTNVSQYGIYDKNLTMEGKGFFDDVYSKVLKPTADASLDALGKSLPILSQAGIEYATRKGEQRLRGKGKAQHFLLEAKIYPTRSFNYPSRK